MTEMHQMTDRQGHCLPIVGGNARKIQIRSQTIDGHDRKATIDQSPVMLVILPRNRMQPADEDDSRDLTIDQGVDIFSFRGPARLRHAENRREPPLSEITADR